VGFTTIDYTAGFNYNRRLAESWAQAVGWFITARQYGGIDPQNTTANTLGNPEMYQNITINEMKAPDAYYTPAFIDLIDNLNQGDPNDQANNYILAELEATLAQCPKNWYAYRDKLAERTNNATENQMQWIFNNYK
jgi:hypothetical protein